MQITLEQEKNFIIEANDGYKVTINTESREVQLGNYNVSFPGEYEKHGILLEVKEYKDVLYYHFVIDDYHVALIPNDDMELNQEMLSFFGDIDILFILGNKKSVKIFDNIEAKAVIPYGEEKDLFFLNMNVNPEATDKFKLTKRLEGEEIEFINII